MPSKKELIAVTNRIILLSAVAAVQEFLPDALSNPLSGDNQGLRITGQ